MITISSNITRGFRIAIFTQTHQCRLRDRTEVAQQTTKPWPHPSIHCASVSHRLTAKAIATYLGRWGDRRGVQFDRNFITHDYSRCWNERKILRAVIVNDCLFNSTHTSCLVVTSQAIVLNPFCPLQNGEESNFCPLNLCRFSMSILIWSNLTWVVHVELIKFSQVLLFVRFSGGRHQSWFIVCDECLTRVSRPVSSVSRAHNNYHIMQLAR